MALTRDQMETMESELAAKRERELVMNVPAVVYVDDHGIISHVPQGWLCPKCQTANNPNNLVCQVCSSGNREFRQAGNS